MIGHSNLNKQQRNDVAEVKKRRSNAHFEDDIGSGQSATPTVWPCQINGCTKTFVREADLKRHQKTTKTHSNPSFQCEDCNARFTRTDALRRHKRSRHHVNRELHIPRVSSENASSKSTAEFDLKSTRGSSLSEGSVRSRSMSPHPSQVYERECRERDRRSREPLPSSDLTEHISRYSRYAYTDLRMPSRVSPRPPSPPPKCFRGQPTQSSSLNAILASPIPTPRLQPVKWSIEDSSSPCGRTSPPPRLPPSLRGGGRLVTRSAKGLSRPVDATLSPHRPALSHGPNPSQAKPAHAAGNSRGSAEASNKGHQPPVTSLSPPPPIVSAPPNSRSTPSFNFDSSDEDEDQEEEFDELLPSSPEPEPEDPEGPSFRIRNHRIQGIDACVDPGITSENVKAAKEAAFKNQQRQGQQKVFTDSSVRERDTRGRQDLRGGKIHMDSTVDRDGIPFPNKASPSLSSSSSLSSSTLVNDCHDVHSRYGRPDVRRKPGKGSHADSIRSSSPFITHLHGRGRRQIEDDEEMDTLVGGSFSDIDTDERSNTKMYTSPAGRDERATGTLHIKGGRLGKVTTVHGINESHEYDDDDEDNYGLYSPSLDRSHPQYLTYDLGEHMVRPGLLT